MPIAFLSFTLSFLNFSYTPWPTSPKNWQPPRKTFCSCPDLLIWPLRLLPPKLMLTRAPVTFFVPNPRGNFQLYPMASSCRRGCCQNVFFLKTLFSLGFITFLIFFLYLWPFHSFVFTGFVSFAPFSTWSSPGPWSSLFPSHLTLLAVLTHCSIYKETYCKSLLKSKCS